MKNTLSNGANFFPRAIHLIIAAVVLAGAPAVRAGLTLEMNVIRYDYYGYYFSPYLNTNTTPPSVPFGDYFVTSSGQPTNGSSALYHFTTNGFNQVGGGPWGYGDFNSMLHELTNGNWSIFVTNSVTTNVYHFTVTASITSNALPNVVVTFPTNGAVNVTNQPTFTWQGPANYSDLVVYEYNNSPYLPVTQTSWLGPSVLYQGINNFTAHYDSNSTTAVVSSVPTNASGPISSWVSTAHLQDYYSSQFTVGTVDTSGTSHTLVAHYPWDGTNNDGTVSGVDTSGNGYNMDFSGSYGPQGGVNSTTTAMAGSRAIQLHDGDFGSAGYVGWNPTPTNLLSALAGSFSISCWIKTTQNNFGGDSAPAFYGAGIVSADNGGLANDVVPIALTGNTIGFNTGGDVEDVTLNSVTIVNDGNYHHVVVTRNQQTGQKIIYIDGVLDSFSSGTTNLLNAPQKLTIGALGDASDPNASDFNYYNGYDGELDDLQIYSGALSAGEVANLFANPGSTAANGGGSSGGHKNVAHYAFDDSTSIIQLGKDSSPNGNSMINYNYWGPVHTNSADAVAGGGAVRFFGTSRMICYDQVLTNLNAVLAGSFTFSAWVKTTVSNGADGNNAYFGAVIFWAYNDHGDTNDTIPLSITGSKAAFTTRDHLGNNNTLHSITSVNDGNYHLITVTRDQGTGEKKIYVDGNFETSEIGTTEPLNGNNYDLTIGGYPYIIDGTGTNYSSYNGLLDDVQIYSGVLSGSDVAYLYNHPGSNVPDTTGQDFNAALNTTGLTWTTSGDTSWFVETTNTYNGAPAAAQSGSVTYSQTSTLSTTVTGPGTLTFYWSSIANDPNQGFDYEFYLDNDPAGHDLADLYNGVNPWAQAGTFNIPAGMHTLSWTICPNGDTDPAQAGFLDQVSYVVTTAPVITLNPFDQTNYPGYNVALLAAATSANTNAAITWQWFKVGSASPIPNATSALFIPTNSGTAGVAGSYYGVASNVGGSANTTTAAVSFMSAPLPSDWSRAFRSPLYNNASDPTTNYNIACVLDSTGTNLYSVGSINGTNTFGSDSLISIDGKSGSSILKQTAAGAAIWGRCMTNNGNGSSYAQCVALAPGDGVYVAGDFFGTNWLGTNKLVDIGGASIYLARFDANGSNLWVRVITGTNGNYTTYHMLASDPAGNVTLSTLISGSTSFGTTNIYLQGQQGVLVQYDANGNLRWLQVPSAWPDYLTYNGGCIYGCMGGSAINYIGGVTNLSDRGQAVFSLNATNGQGNWVRGIANPQGQGNPLSFANNSVSLAVSGTNIFLVGSGWGTNFLFGPFSISFPPDTYGQYFARYDTNGNAQLVTTFGSQYTWPWAAVADASGNVYVGGDFDTYSVFGNNFIAAPFYDTIQFVGTLDNRIPGQGFLAKFDRNGNPLWARVAESQSSYLNLRDVALDPDGVWGCGFFNQIASFGTNTIYGGLTIVGSPFGYIQYHPGGYLAKITDAATMPLAVKLVNPQNSGANFQFQFLSQSGFNHSILYRTNLVVGNWHTNSTVTGDGTVKTISLPFALFSPAQQGFIRVSTQ
jgi:hypothetical protein